MNLVIINADDFGYSHGINEGIIQAHEQGILSSTTMMANMLGFDHGVRLAKEHPSLGIGVHLTLTCGSPVLDNVSSLTVNNKFRHISFYENDFTIDVGELYREWNTQIQKILDAGIQPTHLDSHHHVNRIPPIKDIFVKLAREHNLPVRNNFDVPSDLKTVRKFFMGFDALGQTKGFWKEMTIKNLIQDCKTYETIEVMCHPGYIDHVVLNNSSLTSNRAFVTAELQNPRYKNALEKEGIKIGTYQDLS